MKYLKVLILSFILLIPNNILAYSNYIIAGGNNIGIEINSQGILVIGFYKVDGKYNKNDINIGDYIIKVQDIKVNTIDELVNNIDKYQVDGKVNLTIKRNSMEKEISFNLIKSDDIYKTGLYVKDSISGIGTLTYIDPNTKIYGALGHEIIDSTTKSRIEVREGKIFKSDVTSIDRSVNGSPGTKNARFYSNIKYGNITKNTIHGIYGIYDNIEDKKLTEVGEPNDLKLGKAYIQTVTKDDIISSYEIKITKIDKNNSVKNIYFEIVDKDLLDKTGGIVQGMSGSPIIQDDKIFGAVTHVVIENVKKGYGVFITTMLSEGEK